MKRLFITILISLPWAILGCNPSTREGDGGEGIEPEIKEQSAEEKVKNGILNTMMYSGDSILHLIHDGNKLLYESLTQNKKKKYNRFYPLVEDDFLFEDKFYLKINFPLAMSGEITFRIPQYPDYVTTPLGKQQTQVVINNALDLNQITFQFEYFPSIEDSLVQSEYTFQHVVFK